MTELPKAHGVFRITWSYQNMKVRHPIKNDSMSLITRRNEISASLTIKKHQHIYLFKRHILTPQREKINSITAKIRKNIMVDGTRNFSIKASMGLIPQLPSINENDTGLEMMHRLTIAASFKDVNTGTHLKRVSLYARLIAQSMGTSLEFQDALFHAAPMHDIGKLGIPDAILLKPGRLTDAEMKIMHTHPDIGYKILCGSQNILIQLAAEIARTHHEKFNGSGYPSGLRGQEIPLAGRIVAVADVFDALNTPRTYKKGWSFDLAVKFMIASSGTHFDPVCIGAFLRVLPEVKKITIDFHQTASSTEI